MSTSLRSGENIHSNCPTLKTKLKAHGVNKKTRSAYRIYLDGLAIGGRRSVETLLQQAALLLGHDEAAEKYNWQQLTFEKVDSIRATLIDIGYSVSTINLALSALKGVTKVAFNLGKMSADNMMRINSVKSLKGNAVRIGRRLTRLEINQLLKVTTSDLSAKNARDIALLSIGIGAGLRCSEICALDLSDIDFKDELLTIKQGKGRKHRQIYLAKEILGNVNTWLKFRGSHKGSLFNRIRKDGRIEPQRLSASGLAHALKALQEEHSVKPFSPHDMRRTFITQLLENNVDINTVRQLAGHSDVSTTIRYDKRDLEWQKRASTDIRL